MSKSQGSSNEAIGRPAEWREGRYQQPGKSVSKTVADAKNQGERPADTVSTTVTRDDYEVLKPPPTGKSSV
jgi:hypothetical protein